MVTHGLNYLPYCDLVVVVKNGRFQEIGLYRDLVADGGAFAEFLEQYFRQVPDEEIEGIQIIFYHFEKKTTVQAFTF